MKEGLAISHSAGAVRGDCCGGHVSRQLPGLESCPSVTSTMLCPTRPQHPHPSTDIFIRPPLLSTLLRHPLTLTPTHLFFFSIHSAPDPVLGSRNKEDPCPQAICGHLELGLGGQQLLFPYFLYQFPFISCPFLQFPSEPCPLLHGALG